MIRVHSKLLTGLVMSDLFSAAMQGDLATLEVAQKAGNLHVTNAVGSTLLFYAVLSDNLRVLEFLKNAGLSVNAQRLDGETPLHIACIRNKPRVARWLLENGADSTLKDKWSRRPAECLSPASHEIAEMLKEPFGVTNASPMSTEEFISLLRQRLANRWRCAEPTGYSEAELRNCWQSDARKPEVFQAFLVTCGIFMGDMFRSYEFTPFESESSRMDFEGFIKAFAIDVVPAVPFLSYLREEYWAFPRESIQAEADDPFVIHITVEGVQRDTRRLSEFFLTWEQFE